jgi:probable F420-dependent oxidoreductase
MREYLTAMDASPFGATAPEEPPLRLLAALGPKMLELSAFAADGAHPYWTTPEHTAMAREVIGPEALLCVEQKVVLSTDADAARAAGIEALGMYASLPNYRNNWKRLGFTEDEIEQRDKRFVDAVVVWGDEDRVRAGVQAHYDAGADHVCVQPLSTEGALTLDWHALEALAPNP